MPNKNDIFDVKIEDMGIDGEGIGKVDGYTLFVKDAVIGDVVRVKVMKAKKNYGYARMMELLESSSDRVEPVCPIARPCGGCQLQHLSYEKQLEFKENKVRNNLMKIGKLSESDVRFLPILGMNEPLRYRNKAQYPVRYDKDGNIVMGFYAGRTHSVIETKDCFLGVEENQYILSAVKRYMEEEGVTAYDEEGHKGLVRHILIRKGFSSGQIMVCVVINGTVLPKADKLVGYLVEVTEKLQRTAREKLEGRFGDLHQEKVYEMSQEQVQDAVPLISSISININQEKSNVILGEKCITLYGADTIVDTIGDVQFDISPQSFFQVNPLQTQVLYSKALEFAGLTGKETVWDLYCGIGTISLFLAKKARQVYGVEIVPQAIEDARKNAKINGIDNAEFFVGKAEEVLPDFYKKEKQAGRNATADVIVVDPPRKGCAPELLDTIVKMQPERVVYVSCDSATLARDLKYMDERGYKTVKVQPVDMFGMTVHVETVVLLSQHRDKGI